MIRNTINVIILMLIIFSCSNNKESSLMKKLIGKYKGKASLHSKGNKSLFAILKQKLKRIPLQVYSSSLKSP